jgi:hypothetical protein
MALASAISARAVRLVVLVAVLSWLLISLLKARPGGVLEAEERRALLLVGAALGIAIAKALWSLRPSGELYHGTIYLSLEVGDRSDTRISYVRPPGLPRHTIVPLRLFFLSAQDQSVNTVYQACFPCSGGSPSAIHFFFQY